MPENPRIFHNPENGDVLHAGKDWQVVKDPKSAKHVLKISKNRREISDYEPIVSNARVMHLLFPSNFPSVEILGQSSDGRVILRAELVDLHPDYKELIALLTKADNNGVSDEEKARMQALFREHGQWLKNSQQWKVLSQTLEALFVQIDDMRITNIVRSADDRPVYVDEVEILEPMSLLNYAHTYRTDMDSKDKEELSRLCNEIAKQSPPDDYFWNS